MLAKLIRSTQHPIVKQIVRLRKSGSERRTVQRILLYGEKMIREWPSSKKIFFLLTRQNHPFSLKAENHFCFPPEIMKKMAGYEETAVAVVEYPEEQKVTQKDWIVVLDQIQDPSNLGGLFRSALGLFWEGVILLEGCCDPFHEKAIRTSRASVAKLPYQKLTQEEFASFLKKQKKPLWIADLKGKPLKKIESPKGGYLLLGNEGHGPSKDWAKLGTKVTLPMNPDLESYNVGISGALIMYHLKNFP